jgi:hypothetical protein
MEAILIALENVALGFLQLEFAIRLLSYCEMEMIKPSDFDAPHLTFLEGGERLNFPSGHFSTNDDLVKAAGTSVMIAFSVTALVLDEAFAVAMIKADPEAGDNTVRLRTLVYMIRCAMAHGIAAPQWEVRDKYLRNLTVDLEGTPLSLDLRTMHGREFNISQIGGYANWYRIRSASVRALVALC